MEKDIAQLRNQLTNTEARQEKRMTKLENDLNTTSSILLDTVNQTKDTQASYFQMLFSHLKINIPEQPDASMSPAREPLPKVSRIGH